MARKQLGAAAVIFDGDGQVLLVKHSYGRLNWELPGGGAEEHESLEETARREVREETGLRVAAERLSGLYYEREADLHHAVFVCRPEDGWAMPRPDAAEVTDCAYWPPEALPRPISDFTVQRIHDALAGAEPVTIIVVPPRQWLE
jgi:8-oxo-dGTP diphosphatase